MHLMSVTRPLVEQVLCGVRTTYKTVKLVENLEHAVVSALLAFYWLQVLAITEVGRPFNQVELVLRNAHTVIRMAVSTDKSSVESVIILTEPKVRPSLLQLHRWRTTMDGVVSKWVLKVVFLLLDCHVK